MTRIRTTAGVTDFDDSGNQRPRRITGIWRCQCQRDVNRGTVVHCFEGWIPHPCHQSFQLLPGENRETAAAYMAHFVQEHFVTDPVTGQKRFVAAHCAYAPTRGLVQVAEDGTGQPIWGLPEDESEDEEPKARTRTRKQ